MCDFKVEQTENSLQYCPQLDQRLRQPQRCPIGEPVCDGRGVDEQQAPVDQQQQPMAASAQILQQPAVSGLKPTATVKPFSVTPCAPASPVRPTTTNAAPIVHSSKIVEPNQHQSLLDDASCPGLQSANVNQRPSAAVKGLVSLVDDKATCCRSAGNSDKCSAGTVKCRTSADGATRVQASSSLSPATSTSQTRRTTTTKRAEVAPLTSFPTLQSLPDGYARVAQCAKPSSKNDEERLILNCRLLEQSTFYAGGMTSNDAKDRLRSYPVGTFVVRDSAHPRYLYSLSVKTSRGVTSIRLSYDPRGFSLDAEPEQAAMMRCFNTIHDLVAHYTAEGRRTTTAGGSGTGTSCVFLERSGRRDLPVFLTLPYLGGCGGSSTAAVSSLKHLTRLAINASLAGRNPDRLVINPTLKGYLKEYQYDM